jgi:hypothetical protein
MGMVGNDLLQSGSSKQDIHSCQHHQNAMSAQLNYCRKANLKLE